MFLSTLRPRWSNLYLKNHPPFRSLFRLQTLIASVNRKLYSETMQRRMDTQFLLQNGKPISESESFSLKEFMASLNTKGAYTTFRTLGQTGCVFYETHLQRLGKCIHFQVLALVFLIPPLMRLFCVHVPQVKYAERFSTFEIYAISSTKSNPSKLVAIHIKRNIE